MKRVCFLFLLWATHFSCGFHLQTKILVSDFARKEERRNPRITMTDDVPQSLQNKAKQGVKNALQQSILPISAALFAYTKQMPSTRAMGNLPEFSNQPLLLQDVSFNVQDIDKEVEMIEELFQGRCKELRRFTKDQEVYSVVGFGPDAFEKGENFVPGVTNWNYYGGHGTITLRSKVLKGDDDVMDIYDRGNGFQCIKVGASTIRISKAIQKGIETSLIFILFCLSPSTIGGVVKYAYGWIDIDSPNNLPYHVIIGERFDPLVAPYIRVKNVNETGKWLEDQLGMKKLPFPLARTAGSMYEPVQPRNSSYYGYSEDSMGLLIMSNTFDSFDFISGKTELEESSNNKNKGNILSGLFGGQKNNDNKVSKTDIQEDINIGNQFRGFTILVDDQVKDKFTLPDTIQNFLKTSERQQIITSPDGYPFILEKYSSFKSQATKTVPFDLTDIQFPSPTITDLSGQSLK